MFHCRTMMRQGDEAERRGKAMKRLDEARPTAANPQPPPVSSGVDPTLIRWMLSLTPLERLRAVQNAARAILKLRERNRKP